MAAIEVIRDRLERSAHLDVKKQIVELCSIRDQLDCLIGTLATQLADSGGLGDTRFTNPASWLAAESNRAKGSVTRTVRRARLIDRFAGIAEGVEDHTLTTDHLDMLARMVPARRTVHRAEMFDAHHHALVQLAREHDYDDWIKLCRAWVLLCDDADPHAKAPEDKDLGIDFTDHLDGTTSIGGLILTTDALVFKEALYRIADQLRESERQEAGSDSSEGERADPDVDADGDQLDYTISEYTLRPVLRRGHRYFMARAISHLAERALVVPEAGKTPEPLLVVLMDSATFTAEKDRWALGGLPGGPDPVFRPGYTCQTLDGDPIGPEQAFRIALDHRIARCVIHSPSRRVDLGRTQRLFTGAARDAVIWRDRHCQAPGCRRPARWCAVDHRTEWQDGGHTDSENGELLCPLHHRAKTEARERERRRQRDLAEYRRARELAEPF